MCYFFLHLSSFGEIAKASRADNVRNKQRAENVASVKNRRLAAQMSKRMGFEETLSPKATIKSRLTIPVTNRLGTKTGGPTRGGTFRTRGQSGRGNVMSRFQRGRGQTRGRGGATIRGGRTNRGGKTTRGGRGALRGGRGALRGGRGGQNTQGRGRQTNKQATGAGRGRGRGGKAVTKEQLDSELDKYMSKTKSVLNSQLDEYMKGSD